MPNTLQIKRGLQVNLPTGIAGELLFTTDTKRVYIGDGATNNLLQGASSILTTGMVSFSDSLGKLTGSSSLYWDNTNGRLGIGTSTPSAPLHVVGAAIVRGNIDISQTGPDGSGQGRLIIGGIAGAQSSINMYDNTGKIVISPANSSGVNIIGPLSITGALSFAGSLTLVGGQSILSNANSFLMPYDGATGNFIIQATTINDTLSKFRIRTGATPADRLTVFGTGNVAINTTTDAGFRLDVNGTARVSGILSLSSPTGGYAYLQDTSALASINVIAMQNAGGNYAILSRTSTGGYVADHYGIVVGSASNSYQRWMTSGSERMRLVANGNLLLGTTTDIASSKLTIESTTQGFLCPRMTTTQKNAIATPAAGLMVYDTTLNLISVYNGTTWITL
jgi:hypothetical protein